MPNYTCKRCGYVSNIKTHLRNHLSRKHPCSNLFKGPSVLICLSELSSEKTLHSLKNTEKCKNITENSLKIPDDSLKNTEEIQCKNVCSFCGKVFSRKDNMIIHIRDSCTKKTLYYSASEVSEILKDRDQEMKDKDRRLRDNDILMTEMRKQIEVLLTKVGNTNISINVLNGFGKEDTSYITGDYVRELIGKGPYQCIPNLIKSIHFNPDHQENHNIKIPNRNKNIAQIYNGTNWELANKQDTLSNMSDKAYNMINEHYDDGSNKYMDGFKERLDDKNIETTKKIQKDVELTVLNSQEIIK
jgi:hypothetical protein